MSAPFADEVGLAVRKERRAQGMTQEALGWAVQSRGWGIDTTGVTKIEAGRRDLRLSEIATLADALGVPVARLIRVTVPPDEQYRAGFRAGIAAACEAIATLDGAR